MDVKLTRRRERNGETSKERDTDAGTAGGRLTMSSP